MKEFTTVYRSLQEFTPANRSLQFTTIHQKVLIINLLPLQPQLFSKVPPPQYPQPSAIPLPLIYFPFYYIDQLGLSSQQKGPINLPNLVPNDMKDEAFSKRGK